MNPRGGQGAQGAGLSREVWGVCGINTKQRAAAPAHVERLFCSLSLVSALWYRVMLSACWLGYLFAGAVFALAVGPPLPLWLCALEDSFSSTL